MPTPLLTFLFKMRFAALALSASGVAQTPDATVGKPDVVIIAAGMPSQQQSMLLTTARGFYQFWNTNDDQTLKRVVSSHFVDRNLPNGRPQGPTGPSFANTQFHKAVPDLHCEVTQQIIAGDRVVSNLRFTGHFTGIFGDLHGDGQTVDFVATDILRIESGKITDNWHLEDNLSFQQQIGAIRR